MIRYTDAVIELRKESKEEKSVRAGPVKKEELFELARQLKPLDAESQGIGVAPRRISSPRRSRTE